MPEFNCKTLDKVSEQFVAGTNKDMILTILPHFLCVEGFLSAQQHHNHARYSHENPTVRIFPVKIKANSKIVFPWNHDTQFCQFFCLYKPQMALERSHEWLCMLYHAWVCIFHLSSEVTIRYIQVADFYEHKHSQLNDQFRREQLHENKISIILIRTFKAQACVHKSMWIGVEVHFHQRA